MGRDSHRQIGRAPKAPSAGAQSSGAATTLSGRTPSTAGGRRSCNQSGSEGQLAARRIRVGEAGRPTARTSAATGTVRHVRSPAVKSPLLGRSGRRTLIVVGVLAVGCESTPFDVSRLR